jgi:xanthosine utilization system XapX-like protein
MGDFSGFCLLVGHFRECFDVLFSLSTGYTVGFISSIVNIKSVQCPPFYYLRVSVILNIQYGQSICSMFPNLDVSLR